MTNTLIETHLGYAHAMVAEFAGKYPPNVTRGDLNGAAELGLVQAAQSYDPARGVCFSTFAYFRIRGAIFDEVRKLWQASTMSGSAPEPREEEHGEGGTETGHGDAPEQFAGRAQALTPEALPCPRESPACRLLRLEQAECIRKALSRLPERHRFVLQAYYYDGVSMVRIGEQLNLSKSWVSRIHAQALVMVKTNMDDPQGPRARRSRRAVPGALRRPAARRKLLHGNGDNR